MRQCRLIYDHPLNGILNMAVDETLLNTQNPVPTLRFYAWSPACLSLGYGQRAAEVDTERLNHYRWDVLRRPTGGRAILHTDELTYSLILPPDDPIAAGGVIESYQRISQALLHGLERLGATPQAIRDENAPISSTGPVCFDTPSHYEITLQGRKLLGSAQLRRKIGILQHGSLPLTGDITRICDVLKFEDEEQREAAKAHLRTRAITLSDALNQPIDWRQAADALAEGFAQVFDLDYGDSPITLEAKHRQQAEHYAQTHYASPAWTYRR